LSFCDWKSQGKVGEFLDKNFVLISLISLN